MLHTEYDEAETMELFKEEGREEGWRTMQYRKGFIHIVAKRGAAKRQRLA